MNFNDFSKELSSYVENIQYQRGTYLNNQIVRYYESYNIIKNHLVPGTKILSIGGGSCYLEAFIKNHHDVEADVIDFPEVIAKNEEHYNKHEINFHGENFVDNDLNLSLDHYNMIFSLEVIEHVKQAPSEHFKKFSQHCKNDSKVFISTPNVGTLVNIYNMVLGRPYLQTPELTFSPTSKQNEFIHRREYFPKEMEDSIAISGIKTTQVDYLRKTKAKGFKGKVKGMVFSLMPKYRPIFMITGKLEK